MIDRDRAYLLKEAQRTLSESDTTAAFCLCQRWILKDTIALLKEQESVIEALKSDLDETLAVLGEQPEIVRCRECKYWRQLYGDKPFYSHIGCCDCDDVSRKINDCGCYPDFRTDSDWFCADGKRKSNGKDNEN